MKHLFKFFCLLALTSLLMSCGGDDDDVSPTDDLAQAKLSFTDDTTPIEVPAAMTQSTDEVAAEASGFVNLANAISQYITVFQPPAGATKSSTPVTASNGRIAQTQEEYLVYTWTGSWAGQELTIAYQISQTAENYVFEVFFKYKDDTEFLKFIHAEESKTVRKGFMDIYSLDTSSTVVFSYKWETTTDGTFFFDVETDGFVINLIVNPDKSGSLKYYLGGELYYDIMWTAEGSGTWTRYSDPVESGSW